jgi:hypothetical protein
MSLAVFKPTRITDFICEQETREWDLDKVREMRELTNQLELFADNSWRETFQVIPKLPYSFSYRFEDAAGRSSELQVLHWEAGHKSVCPAFGIPTRCCGPSTFANGKQRHLSTQYEVRSTRRERI